MQAYFWDMISGVQSAVFWSDLSFYEPRRPLRTEFQRRQAGDGNRSAGGAGNLLSRIASLIDNNGTRHLLFLSRAK
jgi:hypothetical protein